MECIGLLLTDGMPNTQYEPIGGSGQAFSQL